MKGQYRRATNEDMDRLYWIDAAGRGKFLWMAGGTWAPSGQGLMWRKGDWDVTKRVVRMYVLLRAGRHL